MKRLLLATTAIVAFSAGAQAADLAAPRMPIAAAVVMPAFSWTGFYVGAHLGYGHSPLSYTVDTAGLPTVFSRAASGVLGGAQIGYNYQVNNVVLGVEADYSFSGVRTGVFGCTIVAAAECTGRVNGVGSLRARVGVAADRALLYVTAGLGVGSFRYHRDAAGFPGVLAPVSSTRAGWVVGAGGEFAVAQNVSIRAEYLYYNFGAANFGVPGLSDAFPSRARSDVHSFRVGVNYLFSTGPDRKSVV